LAEIIGSVRLKLEHYLQDAVSLIDVLTFL